MRIKLNLTLTQKLVILDVLLMISIVISTIITLAFEITPPDALKSIYAAPDSTSIAFSKLFIASLILTAIAWTMILCRKKSALSVYMGSIAFNYFPSFF